MGFVLALVFSVDMRKKMQKLYSKPAISVKNNSNFKISALFYHLYGLGKRAAI